MGINTVARRFLLREGPPLWYYLFLLVLACNLSLSHAFAGSRQQTPFAHHQLSSLVTAPRLLPAACASTTAAGKSRTALAGRFRTDEVAVETNSGWFPCDVVYEDDIFNDDEEDATTELENKAVALAARIVRNQLNRNDKENLESDKENVDSSNVDDDKKVEEPVSSSPPPTSEKVTKLVKGRFMDLTCTTDGERALESMFDDPAVAACTDDDVIRGAVMVFQSLCVMGTQAGVKGAPEQLQRMVSHLDRRDSPELAKRDLREWDRASIRRLKYKLDKTPGTQLLAELLWKRTSQGAYEIMVELGVWKKHEDLALLRSGFPLRFTKDETNAARAAFDLAHDPDHLLGLRQDFRHMKVFTVDSASTSEIDDGLSIEVIKKEDGSERHRVWVHIADADRWAPRDSALFQGARKRITSLYLPDRSISMFPSIASSDLMSLKANRDACALSLGVELNDDGSIDQTSLIFTPSLVKVSYRLTYDDVDEMLAEGIGYKEEWELGALLDTATKRRDYRIRNGSSEGMIPNPVPYSSVSIKKNKSEPDGIGISVDIQLSHNAGKNHTTEADTGLSNPNESLDAEAASAASLLVTESMIMAGEALGRWKMQLEKEDETMSSEEGAFNQLRLPFRTQPPGDFKSRARERITLEDLLEGNVGGGLCHAWFSRRFLQPVKVLELVKGHSGLGLACYIQWSSPIRRFSDLQTHASIKRYLRRRRVHELLQAGERLPAGLRHIDLGWDSQTPTRKITDPMTVDDLPDDLDDDLDFLEGIGLIGASRALQRQSQQYWMHEYVRRKQAADPDYTFTALVLGCVDQTRLQYAVYIQELGLETRYTSPAGKLNIGITLPMKVERVNPRGGILFWVRAV